MCGSENAGQDKKYKLGYVPGVFDLFHIGHLNLIRRASAQSEYLLAGVLSDELVEHFKGKKPFIPLEERMEIVAAIREVDRVVEVNFSNTVKMDAWKLYHYDAYFSGDDHSHEWEAERRALQAVGSDIVYLPYTKGTSSTMIKEKIRKAGKKRRLYLFGAGKMGRRRLTELAASQKDWDIAGFLDNEPAKHLTRIGGVPVYQPKELARLENGEEDYGILITMKEAEAARRQLEELGVETKYLLTKTL
ncbi:MAG: adenylyltransferase/cytidyltransferase family protein [Hungatella sp.]|nr:adenylyltransferase/cytidyltransferase family protein [Hungatella sp.]